jgi:hypothetical protein
MARTESDTPMSQCKCSYDFRDKYGNRGWAFCCLEAGHEGGCLDARGEWPILNDAYAEQLRSVLADAQEELHLIRTKDTDAVYDPTLRSRIVVALAKNPIASGEGAPLSNSGITPKGPGAVGTALSERIPTYMAGEPVMCPHCNKIHNVEFVQVEVSALSSCTAQQEKS